MKKTTIKKQTLTLIISCSLITLLLSACISLYGMISIKQEAVNVGKEIGGVAAQNSGMALHNEAKSMLLRHMNERSSRIDMIFSYLGTEVKMVSEQMTYMFSHPELYIGREVEEPKRENAQKIATQLHVAPSLNRYDPTIKREIALTAGIGDWLTRIYESNNMLAAVYVASANGYTIMVDRRSEKKFLGDSPLPTPMDFRSRPWYKDAVKKNALLYTEPYLDAYSPNRAITCAMPYHDKEGRVAGVVGAGMFLSSINTIVLSTKVGSSGYGFVMKKDGRVLFSPKSFGDLRVSAEDSTSLFDSDDEQLRSVARKMADGEMGIDEVTIDDSKCYIAYGPLKAMNASFGVVIDKSEVDDLAHRNEELIGKNTENFISNLNSSIYSTFLALFVVIFMLFLMISFASAYLAEWFVRPIKRLNEGVQEIAAGNLDKKLDITTGNEIEELASSFNQMTDELKAHIENLTKATAERQRISTELSVATNIQESMLPNSFPPFPEVKKFDIYASMRAAKEVGGDFYDFYMTDSRHLMITIADVSGKGVPAALFMVVSKTILKNFALAIKGKVDVCELVSNANNQLVKNNDAMMFVTAFVGMLDLDTGVFSCVNAGHNPPLIYRAEEDEYSYVPVEKNFVLGATEDFVFKGQEIVLKPNDKLFFYTDGVTEALNEQRELFGEERLLKVLNQKDVKTASIKETLNKIQEALTEHVQNAEQSDDITMMSVVYNGVKNSDMTRKNSKSLTIKANIENLQTVQDFVEDFIRSLNVSTEYNMPIALCVEEIFVNIASYAYGDKEGDATIEVASLENPKGVEIVFIDSGTPYDPLQRKDPNIEAPIEERGIGGLGIFLVKKNMDEIEYDFKQGQNYFTMKKFF